MHQPNPLADRPAAVTAPPAATYRELFAIFFWIGLTSFGGMWGATKKLEEILIRRKHWISLDEQGALMIAATLIPAPKFLAFGAMVGFRLRGWCGSFVTATALLLPGALLVLCGVMLLKPALVGSALAPVQRAVGIGVAGLLFGNAYQQLKTPRTRRSQKLVGTLLALSVAGATIAGVPLLVSALGGLVIGALIMPNNTAAGEPRDQ